VHGEELDEAAEVSDEQGPKGVHEGEAETRPYYGIIQTV
jgi:hypothetical protein